MIAEVVFLPPIATELRSKLCVVIDVLRATSTLVSMFAAGARRITLAASIPEALEYASGQAERPAVCGESGGLPPAGFDHGNSPREFPLGCLKGKRVVFCTSNGTRAMQRVAEAPVVLAGSLLNGAAVARTAVREARERGLDIALICSGDIMGTKFAIDDAFCAGYLLTRIQETAAKGDQGSGAGGQEPGGLPAQVREAGPTADPHRKERPVGIEWGSEPEGETYAALHLEESAVAALRLYRSYLGDAAQAEPSGVPRKEAILEAFWESHNAQVLRRVGLAEDVHYCAQLDISDCVPRLHLEDGRLVLYAS